MIAKRKVGTTTKILEMEVDGIETTEEIKTRMRIEEHLGQAIMYVEETIMLLSVHNELIRRNFLHNTSSML